MECPICFNIIENSAIGSCTHHFCLKCLVRCCEFGATNCPICKANITEIRQDREFDKLNNPTGSTGSTIIPPTLTVEFHKDTLAGITLVNNYDWMGLGSRGPGVVVSKIDQNHQCWKKGLRSSDILLFINNIPCVDHHQAIQIINRCVMANSKLDCILLKNLKFSPRRSLE